MKRKKLASKILSIILSAAVVMSSSFGGLTLTNVSATEVPADETVAVSDNSTEEVADVQDSDLEETEIAEEQDAAAETETAGEQDTAVEKDTAVETESVEEEKTAETDVKKLTVDSDDVRPETKETDMTLLMKDYVEDSALETALVTIYNEVNDPDVTVDTMTLGDLKKLEVIDLSAYGTITDISGLTYAEGATEINLAGTKVKMIPANEFQSFSNLTTIVLPDELEGIGDFAFQNCKALAAINVSVNGAEPVANTLPSSLKDYDKATAYYTGSNIFNGCSALTEIHIPNFDEGMEAALQKAASMFANCTGLETVTVAKNVSNIPGSAFESAGNGETGMNVTFESGSEIQMIMSGAFKNANLASIDLSNCTQLAQIGDSCFAYFIDKTPIKLTEIKMPVLASSTATMKIGKDAFYKTPLTAMYTGEKEEGFVCIPDYVTELGAGAFYNNTSMTKLQLSANMQEINEHTFDNCTALASVQFADGMTDCKITRIGNAAFRKTAALTSAAFVAQMNRLVKIGDEKITVVENNVRELDYTRGKANGTNYGSDVFRASGITELGLPASLRIINSRSFYEVKNLTSVIWEKGTLASDQTFEINSEAFSGCVALTKFLYTNTTGQGAEFTIDLYAFRGCETLEVFSENGVTNTDGKANALPCSVVKVGKRAFAECLLLPAMSIKNHENGSAPEIAEEVFFKDLSLASAELPSALEVIPKGMYYDAALETLPKFEGGVCSIARIDDYAFFGNRIATVDMSTWSELATIGNGAFAYVDTMSREVYYSDDCLTAPLVKMVLPDVAGAKNGMTWGSAMLQGAINFTTLATKSWAKDGVVYIPNYVSEKGCGETVFGTTAVAKAHWGFTDLTSGANEWTAIPKGMFNNTEVENLADCCLPEMLLVKIGDRAYASCDKLTKVDLSVYPLLTETGDGSFANCRKVTKVVFPNNGLYKKASKNLFRMGFFDGMASGWNQYYSSITEVDFGGVEELGAYCFATCNSKEDKVGGTKADAVWPSSLAELNLNGTNVKIIEEAAFKANSGLTTAVFGVVEKIGKSAFEQCEALDLSNYPMSDAVRIIDSKAFYRCSSIGKVTFGAGIAQINDQAFELCAKVDKTNSPTVMEENTGLTEADFSKAVDLVKIGQKAFSTTGLKKLDLTTTAVRNLDAASTFADNPYLEEVRLGEGVQSVGGNQFSGCVRLNYFSFYSTTTMNTAAFKNYGRFGDDNGNKATPLSKLSFEVKPVELNVGIGKTMKFPYYVNEYVNGQTVKFDEMYIGNAANTDDSIYRYVKVSAATTGYYLNKVDGQAITDSRYFEQVTDSAKMCATIGGKRVTAFDIQGLEPTPAGKTIPFTVTNNFNFASADSDEGVSKKLTTTFNMRVMDIPFYPVIYTDRDRTLKEDTLVLTEVTGSTTGTTEFRAEKENSSGRKTFYYDLKTMVKSNWQPEDCNLIIHSSDPTVVVSSGKKVDGTEDTWLVEAKFSSNKTTISDVTNGVSFTLTPKSHGDAIVTIYPEKCQDKKITWKVQARSDIRDVSIAVPSEFSDGQYVGATFPVIQSISTYFGKKIEYKENGLKDYKNYTDNVLQCSSSNPSIASVDAYGVVTVHRIPTTGEQKTTIYIDVVTPEGDKAMNKDKEVAVKYMQLRNNADARSDAGETVKVTKTASGKDPAEVTYVAPKEGTTSVVIPDTMYVYGVKCKVTSIDPVAFSGNKTLKSVTLGKNITSIPEGAFKGCTNLTSVTMKGKVVEIGDSAFEKCSSLKKIVIPKTVKKIGKKAFYNNKKLTTVTFKTKSKLEEIGDSAFQGCKVMKKITIPSTHLATIGKKAFYNCSKLNKIVVKSKKVTAVGKNAFKGVYQKAQIDVPNSKLGVYKSLFKKGQGKKVKIK